MFCVLLTQQHNVSIVITLQSLQGCQGNIKHRMLLISTHPSPPPDACPDVAQFIVPQRLHQEVCGSQIQTFGNDVTIILGGHNCSQEQTLLDSLGHIQLVLQSSARGQTQNLPHTLPYKVRQSSTCTHWEYMEHVCPTDTSMCLAVMLDRHRVTSYLLPTHKRDEPAMLRSRNAPHKFARIALRWLMFFEYQIKGRVCSGTSMCV